ncbi:hypothetical protein [Lysobacter solisilvae (ex Woo and Kim 2020)]|uniref:Uncharacterized protein n=1 Tax=Agrilutibacter terrestris TaxID=2865112 RepID=A0A7H0FVG0_9GAMM|nr:hypothetical protein [Lysobacter terrestris]QNP40026.1 hypothetical protein H8B22_11015 [Lysobacter terrestris]
MGRTIVGIVVGLVVAWLAMSACEFASLFLHRPPAGMDLRDPQALAAHIAAAPTSAMLVVVVGWMLAALLGGWVAARIARHRRVAALVIGALVVLGVIANSMIIPHPLWMTIAGLVLPLPLAWFAARLATPRPPR